MEQNKDIYNNSLLAGKLPGETSEKLLQYASLIYEVNQKFNITGFKTPEEIFSNLVLTSIEPVIDITVPRGTRIADLGSGAGIPGIVLALFFNDITGIFIESNEKKAAFIGSVLDKLNIKGFDVFCGRAEEAAHNTANREKYDWCFIRALGKLHIMLELGAPFIKENGKLYLYSNIKPDNMPEKEIIHARKLGLSVMSHKEKQDNIPYSGLCLIKNGKTPAKYPRKFAIIKRESELYGS